MKWDLYYKSTNYGIYFAPIILFQTHYQNDFPKPQYYYFKIYFSILFKCLPVRPKTVSYEGKLFLLLSKYLRKFRETQWIYLFHIYEFQHMVMFKILGKPLQNPRDGICTTSPQIREFILHQLFYLKPIIKMTSQNHKIIILKVILLFYLNAFL